MVSHCKLKKALRQAEIYQLLEAKIARVYRFLAVFSDLACVCVWR